MGIYLEDFIAFMGIISVIAVAFQVKAYSTYVFKSSEPSPGPAQYTSFSDELIPQKHVV